MFFSCHGDARSFGAQSDNTKSEQAYLLIKQSLVVISTDIQRLFEKYLRPPGRRFGISKPLTLVEVTSTPQRTEACFRSEIMVTWPLNEERVSQVAESRNASSSKTRHPSRTYGSFAKLRRVSVLEIRTAFQTLIIFLKLAAPPSFVSKISGIFHNNLSFIRNLSTVTIVCAT